MLPEHQRAGRLWIDERLVAAATAQGLPIPELTWLRTDTDFDTLHQTLNVTIGSHSMHLKVREADLDHLPHDPTVQERVAIVLAEILNAFAGKLDSGASAV